MGLLDSFHVSRAIAAVRAAGAGSAEAQSALARLRQIGRGAIPRIVEALPDDPPGAPLTNLLAELTTTVSLPVIVRDGLMSQDEQRAARAREALARSTKYDVNRLIDLYAGAGGALVNIAEAVAAHKDGVTSKSLLRILDAAHKDNQPTLFKLVSQLATEQMLPTLIAFSRNADWEGRYCIAQTIARFSTEGVRDTLLRLAKDPHKMVRQAAAEGLAGLRIPVPVAPLAALLRDPDLLVQTKAIEAMIKLNDPNSVRHLLDVLQDESEHARRAAVEVLNAVGNASAIKDLLQALKDQDWWVRVRAADALGAIGGPKVIDAVLQLLADEDEFMRRCAVEILNTSKDPRAHDHLLAALDDPDWWVRERALDALANMRDARAVPAVLRFLEPESEATPVAVRALATIGDPSAALPITAKLWSPDEAIVREAIAALEALTDAGCAEPVLRALSELRVGASNPDIAEAATRTHVAIGNRVKSHRPGARTPSRDTVAPRASVATDRAPQKVRPRTDTPGARAESARAPAAPVSMADTAEQTPASTRPAGPPAAASRAAGALIDVNNVTEGQILGQRYRVLREIGRGGFGVVLLVEDLTVQEQIALKIVSPHLTEDDVGIARMVHEVRYARKITHENVIRIHDFVSFGRTCAISMEYFASVPLNRKIRRGRPFQRHEALRIVRDVCRGMVVAHAAGIIHRDLKPANILINGEGLVKVVDFGLAAAMCHSHSRVTKTGHLVGTPSYMSPEQVRGLAIDQRTDIYSLGVIMYELMTGAPPYSGDNPMAVLYQHVEGSKQPPRSRNGDISPQLEAVILKAMAVDPEQRYASPALLLQELDTLLIQDVAAA